MNNIKSMADQLRSKIAKPDTPPEEGKAGEKQKNKKAIANPAILTALRSYDLAGHKSMVHIRFETQTAQMLHHLKMATGIEVNKVVGYAVRAFLEQHPELKTIIKQHLQNFEL